MLECYVVTGGGGGGEGCWGGEMGSGRRKIVDQGYRCSRSSEF